jgi:hypothetical protein
MTSWRLFSGIARSRKATKQSISGRLKQLDCFAVSRNDTVGQKGSGGTFLTQQAMRLVEGKVTEIAESQAIVVIGKIIAMTWKKVNKPYNDHFFIVTLRLV